MATVGRGLYAHAVHEFFEGLRTYDVERALAVLADDVDVQSPWNRGVVTGKQAVQEVLEALVGDPAKRPSFTIQDISGDGTVVRLRIMVSGRFGHAPRLHIFQLLHLKGRIHQVHVAPA